MAALTYLASTVLMGLVLLAVAAAVVSGRHWRGYRPTLGGEKGRFAFLSDLARSTTVWILAFLAAGLLVGGGAVLALGGSLVGTGEIPPGVQQTGGALVLGLAGVSIFLYLFYGSYRVARSHGLQRAAAVMVGSWALGLLAVVGVALKLLAA